MQGVVPAFVTGSRLPVVVARRTHFVPVIDVRAGVAAAAPVVNHAKPDAERIVRIGHVGYGERELVIFVIRIRPVVKKAEAQRKCLALLEYAVKTAGVLRIARNRQSAAEYAVPVVFIGRRARLHGNVCARRRHQLCRRQSARRAVVGRGDQTAAAERRCQHQQRRPQRRPFCPFCRHHVSIPPYMVAYCVSVA